jgi:hypothetical protein
MKVQTKIESTTFELTKIVKSHLGIEHLDDVVIELVQEKVQEKTSEDSEGWVDVPKGWFKYTCPENQLYQQNINIEIKQRDGTIREVSSRHTTSCWVQEGDEVDIVKYRLVK